MTRLSGVGFLFRMAALVFAGLGVYVVAGDSQAAFHATATAFAARFGVPEITAEDLRAREAAQKPTLLVDVRETMEQSVSRIPGSHLSNPRAALSDDPEIRRFSDTHAGNPEALIVVYCAGGYRSARSLAEARESFGVPAVNLHGGIVAHANVGGALQQPDGSPTDMVHAYNQAWARFVLPPARATVEPPVP